MSELTTKRADPANRSVWRGRRWAAAVGVIAFVGMVQGTAQNWGPWSRFQSELVGAPIIGWQHSSQWVEVVGYALLGWSLVVVILATEDLRPRWVWSWGGLAVVALISLSTSLAASRNGVALYADRLVWRQGIFSELRTTSLSEITSLKVSCEMVRPYRSFDPNKLVDHSVVTIRLNDGSLVVLEDGMTGYRNSALSRHRLLVLIRQLGHLPRQVDSADPRCVDLIVLRFEPQDQPYVRSLFSGDAVRASLSRIPERETIHWGR
jgi:hypothetical protein